MEPLVTDKRIEIVCKCIFNGVRDKKNFYSSKIGKHCYFLEMEREVEEVEEWRVERRREGRPTLLA